MHSVVITSSEQESVLFGEVLTSSQYNKKGDSVVQPETKITQLFMYYILYLYLAKKVW